MIKHFSNRDMINLDEFSRFKKKPVVIHARRMTEDFTVETLEGVIHGAAGDWLLRGVRGELYSCKHEIFVETYEQVE